MARAPGERLGDIQTTGKEDWGRSKFGQWREMRRLAPGLRFPAPPWKVSPASLELLPPPSQKAKAGGRFQRPFRGEIH